MEINNNTAKTDLYINRIVLARSISTNMMDFEIALLIAWLGTAISCCCWLWS